MNGFELTVPDLYHVSQNLKIWGSGERTCTVIEIGKNI